MPTNLPAHRFSLRGFALFTALAALTGCGSASSDSLFQSGDSSEGTANDGADELTASPPNEAPADDGQGEAPAERGDGNGAEEDAVPSNDPAAAALLECPSYETGFLPEVHDPVCSNCHRAGSGLPDWNEFATAGAFCNTIGAEVASGNMPPNGSLSSAQRSIVLRWVSLGCPETEDAALSTCNEQGDAPSDDEAGVLALITVERARLRDGDLELRGEVSRVDVELTAEFDDRVEPLENDDGEFDVEFEGVNATSVTIRSSDGASVTVAVEVDD